MEARTYKSAKLAVKYAPAKGVSIGQRKDGRVAIYSQDRRTLEKVRQSFTSVGAPFVTATGLHGCVTTETLETVYTVISAI